MYSIFIFRFINKIVQIFKYEAVHTRTNAISQALEKHANNYIGPRGL